LHRLALALASAFACICPALLTSPPDPCKSTLSPTCCNNHYEHHEHHEHGGGTFTACNCACLYQRCLPTGSNTCHLRCSLLSPTLLPSFKQPCPGSEFRAASSAAYGIRLAASSIQHPASSIQHTAHLLSPPVSTQRSSSFVLHPSLYVAHYTTLRCAALPSLPRHFCASAHHLSLLDPSTPDSTSIPATLGFVNPRSPSCPTSQAVRYTRKTNSTVSSTSSFIPSMTSDLADEEYRHE